MNANTSDPTTPEVAAKPAAASGPKHAAAAKSAAPGKSALADSALVNAVRSPGQGWRRVRSQILRPRLNRANVLAWLMFLLLGFAIMTQVRSTQAQGINSLSEDQLVRVLDNLTQENGRLNDQARDLETTRDKLANSRGNSQEALRAANDRLRQLQILAGAVPVAGTGLELTITGADVRAPQLIDAMQELRDAGAESMQIGEVRIVANTWFADTSAGISASGTTLTPPYKLKVIGDPKTMSSALGIPGGVAETIRSKGGQLTIATPDKVEITALHTQSSSRYAQPAPESGSNGSGQ